MSSYGLWLSAAGMKVSDHRQALLANNMANVETAGFKHDVADVTQRRVESRASAAAASFAHPVLDDLSGGVNVGQSLHNFSQGAIEHTARPLDVAISGDGFFVVSDGNATRYTRDGVFSFNSDGQLVLAAAEGRWRVLSDAGAPINLDDARGPVEIAPDGTVRQANADLGRLGLVTTEELQSLQKTGENLFEAPADKMVPASVSLISGARERSNFDVVTGLAKMIEAARAYELNATMVRLQDETTGLAAGRIARVA